jgi:microcystin-dependent protein
MSSNLGVSALEAKIEQYLKAIVPIGTVVAFAGAAIPAGWLLCGGSPVSIAAYPELSAAIGVAHGNGTENADGSASGFTGTHFNLPDYRGRFLRGVDGIAGNDPDKLLRTASKTGGNPSNAVGSVQGDINKLHGHPYRTGSNGSSTNDAGGLALETTQQEAWPAYTGVPTASRNEMIGGDGGSESRPKNANVNYIIRAV